MRQTGNNQKIKLLSVIIPVYNQEKTIKKNIRIVSNALDQLGINYEIIVVIDGASDNTYENASKLSSKCIRVYSYHINHGKGYAIRQGFTKAKGDVIGFIDAGMDIDLSGFSMLLNHMRWYNADVIIGSKLHPVSKVSYPLQRRILSWGYRILNSVLFGFKVRDTQVGLKFFKRKVVIKILPMLKVNTFAFDIEVLAASYVSGYKRIYEAPIELNFRNDSTIPSIHTLRFWRIIYKTLIETFSIYYRLKISKRDKHYMPKQAIALL